MAPRPSWSLSPQQSKLAQTHQGIVSMVAYSFTGDTGLVADLVSVGNESICWAAYRYDPSRGRFADFARSVVRNDMLDFLKARSRRSGREVSQELLGESLGEEGVDTADLLALDLHRALDMIPEELHVILVEFVFEQRSMEEIGSRRGRSRVWAWMRYKEALEALRAAAAQMGWLETSAVHEEVGTP